MTRPKEEIVAGDLVYFVIPAADAERGRSFYGDLFGWRFTPGSVPGGLQHRRAHATGWAVRRR
jgi:predicted enzyme related to lactoylglutathione lyase